MKIGITGGAGFIGSNLVQLLSEMGYQVYVFDNFSTGFQKNLQNLECTIIRGDLRNLNSIKKFLMEGECQVVFHIGAIGSVPRSIENPVMSFENNSLATLNLLEAAREYGTQVIFTSSSSVYGRNIRLPKVEKDWLSPISPYAAAKLAAEALCTSYSESFGMDIKVFRLFNVYGPKQNPDGTYAAVIPRWIRQARLGKSLQIYGDGEQKRDFTFVKDVTSVLLAAMESKKRMEGPINLAFGNPITLNQIIEIFREYYGKISVEYLPKRNGDIKDSESDPQMLLSLGITPKETTTLREGLFKTFEWFERGI